MIICIGKTCGSGGHAISEKLAEKLRYAYYDQNMLEAAAGQETYGAATSRKETLYAQLNEDVSGTVGEAYEGGRAQVMAKKEVILHAASRGNCVFDVAST